MIDPEDVDRPPRQQPRWTNIRRQRKARPPAKPRLRTCVCGSRMTKGPLELDRDGERVTALWWCSCCQYAILEPHWRDTRC